MRAKGDTDELLFACENLTGVGRAADSLGLVRERIAELSNETVFKILDAAALEIAQGGPRVDNMVSYYIGEILKQLRARRETQPEDVARREYIYLPLLGSSAGQNKNESLAIHNLMLKDPSFYVSILCDAFRPANERGSAVDKDADPIAQNRARLGYTLLCNFQTFSTTEGVQFDIAQIEDWVKRVREKAVECDRAEIADLFVGRYLAHSPPAADVWPKREFAGLIERIHSQAVERGIMTERFNMRGVYTKTFGEGGAQERDLESTYRKWADKNAPFRKVAGFLLRIADVWSDEGRSADIRAEQDKLRD